MGMSDELSQSQFQDSRSAFLSRERQGPFSNILYAVKRGDKSETAFKYWVSIAFFLPWADTWACGMI